MLRTKMTTQDDIRAVLKDTIVLLCRNGLRFQSDVNIEALVAVTVDQSEVLLVSIKETIHANILDGSKHSDVVTADQEESASENAIKSELNCSMSEEERDHAVCHVQEHGNSADMPGGLTGRLADSGKGLYNPTEQTATVGLKPDTSSTDSFDESMLPSQETTSSEALDLTGYVRKHKSPATKRKRHNIRSNYVHTNKEVRLHDLWTAVSIQDVDNCSNSGSIVCVKDETPSSPYADAEWSSCLNMPTFLEGSYLGKQSYHKASSSLANSNSLNEDVANAGLSQADHSLSTLGSASLDDVNVQSICQAIIGYGGWCVPLRDVQRLRLRGLPSSVIRVAMETLERTGLGQCREVTGNMCIFYKCPPHLVAADALTRWHLTLSDYSLQFSMMPAVNQTNRHNDTYWQRVASSSPYSYA